MTCFRTAHDMTLSSRAKGGARAEEEGLALRGKATESLSAEPVEPKARQRQGLWARAAWRKHPGLQEKTPCTRSAASWAAMLEEGARLGWKPLNCLGGEAWSLS